MPSNLIGNSNCVRWYNYTFCLVRVLLPPTELLCGSHNEVWRPECNYMGRSSKGSRQKPGLSTLSWVTNPINPVRLELVLERNVVTVSNPFGFPYMVSCFQLKRLTATNSLVLQFMTGRLSDIQSLIVTIACWCCVVNTGMPGLAHLNVCYMFDQTNIGLRQWIARKPVLCKSSSLTPFSWQHKCRPRPPTRKLHIAAGEITGLG